MRQACFIVHCQTVSYASREKNVQAARRLLVLQPIDQRIIQNVKAHYKTKLLGAALEKIESAKSVAEAQKSVNVLDACHWAASAVKAVKATTVVKCFAKCGISPVEKTPIEDDDEDDVPLMQLLGLATTRSALQDPIDVSEYIDIDSCAPATEDLLDDSTESEPDTCDDEDDDDQQDPPSMHKTFADA